MATPLPASADAPTTLDRTVVGNGAQGFQTPVAGPGWARVTRDEIASARAGREKRRDDLLYFGQMTDFQLADEESPARVEFLDVDRTPLTAAWRPQEALTPFLDDQQIRQVNAHDSSPVAQAGNKHASMDFAITTGDSADNQERNEVGWVVRLLEGGSLTPNSGVEGSCQGVPAGEAARYTGVQDYNDYNEEGSFYDPNSPIGKWAAWPRYPGLMDRAQQSFQAAGLKVPSYVAFGNHDGLAQGNQAANAAFEALAVGCLKPYGPVPLGSLDPAGLASLAATNPGLVQPVPADPERRYVSKAEYRALHGGQGHQADAHGFGFVDPSEKAASGGSVGYYAWSPKPGFRFVAMDTVCSGGVAGPSAEGNIDDPQFRWITRQIEDAERSDETVVLFGHHPIRSLTCSVPDEAAPPCTVPGPYGHDINPGCDADPRNSGPIHPGADLQALALKHSNVIAYVAGHTHEHKITPFKSGSSGFWGIETSSEVDWPIQARLIDVMNNNDGTISIFGTIIDAVGDPATPAPGTGAASLDPAQLAQVGRTLSLNDPQAGATYGIGKPEDRNTELVLPAPPSILARFGAGKGAQKNLRLKVKGRCSPRVLLSIGGKDRGKVGRADFYSGKRRVGRDRKAPFRVRVKRRRLGKRGKRVKLSARVTMKDKSKGRVARRVRLCKKR